MRERYERLYAQSPAYWGSDPSPLALLTLAHRRQGTVLDLGCGQGPDALFFARKGLRVLALDVATTALQGLARRAEQEGLAIEILERDMRDLPAGDCDIVFSRMALQMLAPEERPAYLAKLKARHPRAVHAHVVPIRGACFGDAFICEDGLLREAYADWDILFAEDAWTLSRVANKDGEPYLMRESRIIARAKDP